MPSELHTAVAPLAFPAANMPALAKAAALNTAAAYKAVPGATAGVVAAAQLAVKRAYVHAFSTTYKAAIAFGLLATVAAFLTRDIDRGMKTGQRAVRLENEKGGEKEGKVGVV